MRLFSLTRRQIIMSVILVGVLVGAVLLTPGLWHHSAADSQTTPDHDKTTKSQSKPDKTPDDSPATSTKQTVTPMAESSSPACQQFTLAVAKTILGPDATVNMADSTIISDTPDLQTSSCVYQNNADDTIHLSAFIAKSPVGESTNSVTFGSDKPAGVQDMPGYGQAAYWDVHTNVLSVLKNNNRYELSRSSNMLDDVRQAADRIVPKL